MGSPSMQLCKPEILEPSFNILLIILVLNPWPNPINFMSSNFQISPFLWILAIISQIQASIISPLDHSNSYLIVLHQPSLRFFQWIVHTEAKEVFPKFKLIHVLYTDFSYVFVSFKFSPIIGSFNLSFSLPKHQSFPYLYDWYLQLVRS